MPCHQINTVLYLDYTGLQTPSESRWMDVTEPLGLCDGSVVQGGMSVGMDHHSVTDRTEALIVLLMEVNLPLLNDHA